MARFFAKVREIRGNVFGDSETTPRSARDSKRNSMGSEGSASARGSQSARGSGMMGRNSSEGASPRTPGRGIFGSARSSGGSQSARGRRRTRPTRLTLMAQLRAPEESGRLAKLRNKLMPKEAPEEEDEKVDTEDEIDDVKDVAEELCLPLEGLLEELGDPQNVALKKAGKLDISDDDTIQRYKRHKAMIGRTLFEAENANNLGIEALRIGDLHSARAYLDKALELSSKERKPAAKELADLKDFINENFKGEPKAFFEALTAGEWRLALGRRRFVTVMKGMNYSGDADRLFELMDHGTGMTDGKVTMSELTAVLKAKAGKMLLMDGEVLHKGVVLSNLAACLCQQGSPALALQRLRAAYKICQKRCEGPDDPLLQRVLINMAVAYMHLNDFDAALNYLQSILQRCESIHGLLGDDTLTVLYLIGYSFLVKANRFDIVFDRKRMDTNWQEDPVEVNYSLSLCAFKERLNRQHSLLGELKQKGRQSNPGEEEQLLIEIAQSHETIAEIHSKRREFSRALPHLKKAAAHKEAVFSDGDPELLSTWNTLAHTLVRLGHFQSAQELMERAVVTAAAIFGEASQACASETYYLGLVLYKVGVEQSKRDAYAARASFDVAIEKLMEVSEMQAEVMDDDDPEIADTMQLLGSVHLSAGSTSSARRCFERALLIRAKALGRTHLATASSAHALGSLYARLPRRNEEAIQLLRKAMVIREKRLGSDSAALADSLHELGSALLQRKPRKDHETALQHLSRAAQIRDKTIGKESLKYAASMHQIGQAHAHLGLFGEAKLYLQAAVALREKLAGKRSMQTAMSRFALGVTMLNLGDTFHAMKSIKSSLLARQELFGLEHPFSADCLHQIGMVHAKKGEHKQGLPFMHRALEIRVRLNKDDAEAREDDSDEDPNDVRKGPSPRDKRIKVDRRRRQRQAKADEKERMKAEKKAMDDLRKEELKSQKEMKKLQAYEDKKERRRGTNKGSNFGGIMSRLSRNSQASSGQGGAAGGDGGAPGRSPRRSDEEEEEEEHDEGGDSGSDRSGGEHDEEEGEGGAARGRGHRSRKGMKRESSAEGVPSDDSDDEHAGGKKDGKKEERDEDEASEASVELMIGEVGVDPRGFLVSVIARSMQAIALVYMDLKEFTTAKHHLRRAACLQEEVYGRVSAEFGEVLHTNGVLNERQGLLVAALRYFRDSLHIREIACGHKHEDTAATCIALGDVLVQLGQPEDANIYLLRGTNIRETLFGPYDPVVVGLKEKWGQLMAAELQYDPVRHGEELPHFARRSPESFLHGYNDRVKPSLMADALPRTTGGRGVV